MILSELPFNTLQCMTNNTVTDMLTPNYERKLNVGLADNSVIHSLFKGMMLIISYLNRHN